MNILASIGICFIPLLIIAVILLITVKTFSAWNCLAAIFLGFAAVIPVTIIQFFVMRLPIFTAETLLSVLIVTFIFNGLIEETLKMAVMLVFPGKKMTLISLVSAGIVLGCAFGTFENVVYLISSNTSVLLRTFTSLLLHSFCTGLAALYVWTAKQKKPKSAPFILAVLLHGLYNYFAAFSTNFWWFSLFVIVYAGIRLKFSYSKYSTSEE